MPRGLGGYRLVQSKDFAVRLDPRQKGAVKCWYAELIERNKYAPGFSARGPQRGG